MFGLLRAALCAALLFSPLSANAHEGHGDEPAETPQVGLAPRATASSDNFELVAVARGPALEVYLDRLSTNEGITDAQVALERPDGPVKLIATGAGIYRLDAPWLATPGSHDLLFTVARDNVSDILATTLTIPPPADAAHDHPGETHTLPPTILAAVGGFAAGVLIAGAFAIGMRRRAATAMLALAFVATLAVTTTVHADEASPATTDRASREPDGTVIAPKPVQRLLAIRTQPASEATHRAVTEMPGRIVPDPNASGYVQASVGGRLSAPNGGFPHLGTPVKKGDVLAYVIPPLQAIDVSDMRQRQGELDQQISIVERRVGRLETLVPGGAATRTQLEEAQLELDGLRNRRAALDKVAREPEALIAPVDGVIAESSAVAGQIASPSMIVYRIIDPKRLWVEALSFDAVAGGQAASARLGDGRSLSLAYAGAGLADRNQAVPINYRIEGDTSGLRLGQFVTVLAPIGDKQSGIAVPRSSVVRGSNGQDTIYVHTEPERFQPLTVRTVPLDADRVLVMAGLRPGARVVTQGAELLAQIR